MAWLVIGAIFCTVYFRLVNFRGFAQALRLVRGDYSNPNDQGEVSHFQALATALSGTVGVGNIGGRAGIDRFGGSRSGFLDDHGRAAGHVQQILRMHAGRQVPQRKSRWVGFRRSDVLAEKRVG